MSTFLKIIIYTFSIAGVFFLIFTTFHTSQYSKIKNIEIDNEPNVNNVISLSASWFIDHRVVTENFGWNLKDNEIFLEKISGIDEIYSDASNSYFIKSNQDGAEIEILEGKFLFNINDLTKKYIFSHKWFIIEPLWTGIFYLDTKIPTDIKIFSKEALLDIKFKDLKTWEIVNNAYLYPHEYLKFNPLINSSIKNNADFIRVKSQVFKWWYTKDKISWKWINGYIVPQLLWKESTIFFENSLSNINNDLLINKEKYLKIESFSGWKIPWTDYVERFFSIFYNDSKKIIYYKNNIVIIII